jgi:hypothetical protein
MHSTFSSFLESDFLIYDLLASTVSQGSGEVHLPCWLCHAKLNLDKARNVRIIYA